MKILSQVLYKHDITRRIEAGSPEDEVVEFCFGFLRENSPIPNDNSVEDGDLHLSIVSGFRNDRDRKQTRVWVQHPGGVTWSYSKDDVYEDIRKAWQNIVDHESDIKQSYPSFKKEDMTKLDAQSAWYIFQDIFQR